MATDDKIKKDAEKQDELRVVLTDADKAAFKKSNEDARAREAVVFEARIEDLQALNAPDTGPIYTSGEYTDVKHHVQEYLREAHNAKVNTDGSPYTLTNADGDKYEIQADGSFSVWNDEKQNFDTHQLFHAQDDGSLEFHIDLNDYNDQKAHPILSLLAHEGLDVERYKNHADVTRIDDINTDQHNILKNIIKDRLDRDAFLNEIATIQSTEDGQKEDQYYDQSLAFQKKLKDKIKDPNVDILMYATLLMNNENMRRAVYDHPNYGELIQNTTKYQAFHNDATIVDIVDYIATGETGDVRREIQPESTMGVNDRFFEPAFYELISDHHHGLPGVIDGGKYLGEDYAGQFLTREEVQEIALQKIVDLAIDTGIAPQDISRAMLEGEFNPYYTDMMIAYDALGDRFDHVGKNKEWNKRFGGLEDISRSGTRMNVFMNGEASASGLTAHDVAFHHFMRIKPGLNPEQYPELMAVFDDGRTPGAFTETYPDIDIKAVFGDNGVPKPENMTYGQAMSLMRATGNTGGIKNLEKSIENTFENQSVITYFQNGTGDQNHGFDFRRDYQDARMNGRYLNNLQHEAEIEATRDNDPDSGTDGYIIERSEDEKQDLDGAITAAEKRKVVADEIQRITGMRVKSNAPAPTAPQIKIGK